MKVVKRDGREVAYDKQKIVIAISKANKDTDTKPEMTDIDGKKITGWGVPIR